MSRKNKHYKKYFFVSGMHCGTCEILIDQDIRNIKNVKDVEVSLSESKVIIYVEDEELAPSMYYLNKLFKDLGYTFHESRLKEKKLNVGDILKIVLALSGFIFLFYMLEQSNLFAQYTISSSSSLMSFFIFGLVAGLSSCAALVGGLLLSVSKKWNDLYGGNKKKVFFPFIYFNLSRIITFAILGGVLGLIGSFFQISIVATSILAILISLLMLAIGFQMLGVSWFKSFSLNLIRSSHYLNKNNDLEGKYIPILIGAATFLVPCGFTIIAQTTALSSGSFIRGFLQMLFFVLGTLPILVLISFSSVKFFSNPLFSKKFSIFAGLLIIFFGFYTLNSQLNVLGFKSLNDLNSSGALSVKGADVEVEMGENGIQIMRMEASGFEYNPKVINIRSGVKTKWIIEENNSLGCAKAVYARGLYDKIIYLESGTNVIEFMAPIKGKYKISCSMGMVSPVTVNVL